MNKAKASKVTKITDFLSYPFSMWLINGGYELSKDDTHLVFKNGSNTVKIHMKNLTLNEVGQERFFIFSKQWLAKGKPFIQRLIIQADVCRRMNGYRV